MEWKDPERFGGGARGSFQLSVNPSSYAVTYSVRDDGKSATLSASFDDQIFAVFYIDDIKDNVMKKNAARAMRAACGMHHEASTRA